MKISQLMVIVCAGALLACGQKGPLVMPDAQKHKRTIPSLPGTAKPAPSGGGATSPAPPAPASPAPAPASPAPATPVPAPAPAPTSGSPSTPAPTDPTAHP